MVYLENNSSEEKIEKVLKSVAYDNIYVAYKLVRKMKIQLICFGKIENNLEKKTKLGSNISSCTNALIC